MEYNTDRLLLRELEPTDVDEFLDFLIRNRDHLEKWEPQRDESYYTKKNALEIIKIQAVENNLKRGIYLGMFLKGSAEIIGLIAISSIVKGPFLSCFLGYKLDETKQGNGYMHEAVTEIIRICFEDYKLHRIEANIIPGNIKSEMVVKKAKFKKEGLSRKYLKINGTWQDHNHFVILNKNIE